MDAGSSFPLWHAQVYRSAEKHEADLYQVIKSAGANLTLQANPSKLRYAPPQIGELIFLEATLPDAICHACARVTGVKTDLLLFINAVLEKPVERKERRRHMRIRARIPVKIRHRPDNPRLALKGVTQNISAGGIHIIHTEPLSVESRVRVALASREERDEHSCGGRVTRCRPMSKHRFEIGIAFLHTHAAFQQHVDCLMREYGRGNSA